MSKIDELLTEEQVIQWAQKEHSESEGTESVDLEDFGNAVVYLLRIGAASLFRH